MTNISLLDALRWFQLWKDIRVRAGWRLQSHIRNSSFRVVDPEGAEKGTGYLDQCRAVFESCAPSWRGDRAVLMLHSLGGTPHQLRPLEQRLNHAGHATANIAYPNLFAGMADHIGQITAVIEGMAEDGIRQISFVGHSYGGLLIRALWNVSLPATRGPVVFFGTPNGGSSWGAMLQAVPGYAAYFGTAGRDVLPAFVLSLPVPDTPMLAVAGGLGRYGFNPLLHGNNDGIVTVAETPLPVPHDFIYVGGCLHRFLPRSQRGMEAALTHLKC